MRTIRMLLPILAVAALSASSVAQGGRPAATVDKDGEKWVQDTFRKMTMDEKVGQLLVSSFQTNFMSTDSEEFEQLVKAVHEYHVGGFHLFGASEPVPGVLLNPTYGSVTLGQPLAAASIVNRLQAISKVPLLNTADFEAGVGFRIM